jgi:hypothetical protein
MSVSVLRPTDLERVQVANSALQLGGGPKRVLAQPARLGRLASESTLCTLELHNSVEGARPVEPSGK